MTIITITGITSCDRSDIPEDRDRLYWKWSLANGGLSYAEWTEDSDFGDYRNLSFQYNKECFQLQVGTTGADGYGIWGILLCGNRTVAQIRGLSQDGCSELRLVDAIFWSQFLNQPLDQIFLERHFLPPPPTWVWSKQQWLKPRDQWLWLYNFQNTKNNNEAFQRVIFDLGKMRYGLSTSDQSFLTKVLLEDVVPKKCASIIDTYVEES